MTKCLKSDNKWAPFSHSHFFNHLINSSSFLERLSFSKELMQLSHKQFLRKAAYISRSVQFIPVNRHVPMKTSALSHKSGLGETALLWPRPVHAHFLRMLSHLLYQLQEVLPPPPPPHRSVKWCERGVCLPFPSPRFRKEKENHT